VIAKGFFKAGDYYHFGRLVAKLEELGAYLISYSPKKSTVFAWFRGGPADGPAEKAITWLKENGYDFKVALGENATWTMVAVRW